MIESLTNSFSFILVFVEGVLSFFSPCIIPLIPIYMGYLAGDVENIKGEDKITYDRKKVFLHTIFFVLGISFAFFILGMSFTSLGSFFQSNKFLFTRIGGIIIIVLGLFQLGIFDVEFLKTDRKFHFNISNRKANPFVAFIMGFTFSFAWTPCVGPVLSSVLILASSSSNPILGNILVFVYSLGFIIPFLLLGLFTTKVLNLLDKNKKLLKYTVKAGAVLLIIMGVMTFTGWMNGISGYLNSFGSTTLDSQQEYSQDTEDHLNEMTNEGNLTSEVRPAPDFTLIDQYGNEHALSDYRGKVVFLNFWATWCPPCQKEMPDIEQLYHKYNENEGEIIIIGVANPKNEEYPNNQDIKKEKIIEFLKKNDLSFPIIFDETGEVFNQYGISAFPTTFMIDKRGNILGYAPGMLSKELMENIIGQTKDSIK